MKPIRLKCLDCNVEWTYFPTDKEAINNVHKECLICGAFGFVTSSVVSTKRIAENFLKREQEEIEMEVPIK